MTDKLTVRPEPDESRQNPWSLLVPQENDSPEVKVAKEKVFAVFGMEPIEGMRSVATKEYVDAYRTVMNTLTPEQIIQLNEAIAQKQAERSKPTGTERAYPDLNFGNKRK